MPKRYTSRELVKLAEANGWRVVSVKGDHHNFKHPDSRFIVTIVHPQKDGLWDGQRIQLKRYDWR
jgi:predicted RNA binding protein YcfA (HicA-like mRNA interferase family)